MKLSFTLCLPLTTKLFCSKNSSALFLIEPDKTLRSVVLLNASYSLLIVCSDCFIFSMSFSSFSIFLTLTSSAPELNFPDSWIFSTKSSKSSNDSILYFDFSFFSCSVRIRLRCFFSASIRALDSVSANFLAKLSFNSFSAALAYLSPSRSFNTSLTVSSFCPVKRLKTPIKSSI